MSQTPLAEKLGINARTITNIENLRGNPRFEVLYLLVTTLKTPTDHISYPETESMGDNKQQLFWELHSLSEREALELLPVTHCLAEMMHKHGSENLQSNIILPQ